MNDDKATSLETAYRHIAQELPTTALDETILGAARRHATFRRTRRRAGALAAVAAFVAVVAVLRQPASWLPHGPVQAPAGYTEGQTRAYLLKTADLQSTTPVALYLTTIAVPGAALESGVPSNAEESSQ